MQPLDRAPFWQIVKHGVIAGEMTLVQAGVFCLLAAFPHAGRAQEATNAVAEVSDSASATNAAATSAAPVRKYIDTRIYKLNHASAEEVAAKFNSMWSGEFGQT